MIERPPVVRNQEPRAQRLEQRERVVGGEVAAPVTVTVRECAPPHRLVVEVPGGDGPPWLLTVTLSRAGEGTALFFEQRLVPGIDAGDVAAGWNWYLDRLGASLRGADMPDWAEYAPASPA